MDTPHCNWNGCKKQVKAWGKRCADCDLKWEYERAMYDKTHNISTLDKLPQKAHFAVLIQDSHTSPGYDRGDPPYSSPALSYCWFETEEALNAWILKQTELIGKKPYRVIYVRPVEVKLQTEITISKE
jgi:hypothetical protein